MTKEEIRKIIIMDSGISPKGDNSPRTTAFAKKYGLSIKTVEHHVLGTSTPNRMSSLCYRLIKLIVIYRATIKRLSRERHNNCN